MIEVVILWDDGSAFVVAMPRDEYSPAEAVEEIRDQLSRGMVIHGRWVGEKDVPQEQFRLASFYERGIRAVMTDVG